MRLGGFRVIISLVQVVAAMAVGAVLPVTALLALELRRPRRSAEEGVPRAAPPEPDRVVDDDARNPIIEAVAQLAAAQFELLDQADEAEEPAPERHLTLIPTARGLRRPIGGPQAEKRSPNSACPPGCAADHPEVLRRPPQRVSRD